MANPSAAEVRMGRWLSRFLTGLLTLSIGFLATCAMSNQENVIGLKSDVEAIKSTVGTTAARSIRMDSIQTKSINGMRKTQEKQGLAVARIETRQENIEGDVVEIKNILNRVFPRGGL